MKKLFYLPRADDDRNIWLKNFSNKLDQYAAKYGLSADDITEMKKCSEALNYWLDYKNQMDKFTLKLTAYKFELLNGSKTDVGSLAPEMPKMKPAPAAVAANIISRIAMIVSKIKRHTQYTIADGNDLGLEGAERIIDVDKMQPALKISLANGGYPELKWNINKSDSLEIFVDRNDGNGFVFLTISTRAKYTDTHELPKNVMQWKYRAIYKIADVRAGLWSNDVRVNVVAG